MKSVPKLPRIARLLWPGRDFDVLLYLATALLIAVSALWMATLFDWPRGR